MNVYKIELMIVDHDKLGTEEIKTILENTSFPNHCIYPRVISSQVREVAWDDSHPLNHDDTMEPEFRRLFSAE